MKTDLFWPSSLEWARKTPTWDVEKLGLIDKRISLLSWAEQGIEIATQVQCTSVEFLVPESLITEDLVQKGHGKGLSVGASLVANKAAEKEWIKKFEKWKVDYVLTER